MHYGRMRDHATIVREAGAPETVADRRGKSVHTVRSWIQRNRIPAEEWSGFAADGWASLEELASALTRKDAA